MFRRKHRKALEHIARLEHEMGMDVVPDPIPKPVPHLSFRWERQGDSLVPIHVDYGPLNFGGISATSASYYPPGYRRP